MNLDISDAARDDLGAINAIYNHYVESAHYTFDIEPLDMRAREEWFAHYDTTGRYRAFVAHVDGAVAGYATSSKLRPKPGYASSIETTIYLAPSCARRGVGTALYETLFAALAAEDIHRAYAVIALPNDASIALHERFGFARTAFFSEQGRKFGRWWDVAWYEKRFEV